MSEREPRVQKRLGQVWGESVRSRRLLLGLTQRQLGDLTDTTQQAIGQFETGVRTPKPRTQVALARALGTTPGELFPWPPMSELMDGAA